MADLKISALTASTTPLAGTEVLPIVQSSTTKQVSVANLTAGRAVSTGILTATHPTQGGFDETLKLVSVANSGDDGPVMTFFGNSATKYYGFIGGYDIAANKGGVKIGVGNGETSISSSMTAVTITNEKNIIAEAGNLVIGTAAKGVTTSSATALGFGTNGSTTQATLATNGTFTAGNMQSKVQTKTVAIGATQNLFYVNNYALPASGFMTIRSASAAGFTDSTYVFNIMGNGIATGVVQLATEIYGSGGSSFTITETRNSPGAPQNQVALVNTSGAAADITVTYQFISGYENVTFI